MFIGALIIIIGTIVQATCHNIGGFIGGRFVLGFGVAISASAGPTYVSEMAHPTFRGTMTAIYNTFWFIGGIPGTFVPYGTSFIPGSMAWRIPTWVQMVFPGIVLIFCLFLPEVSLPTPPLYPPTHQTNPLSQSPRWLIAQDRHEEALNVITKYHGEGLRSSPIVHLSYHEMLAEISPTGADKRWWDYRELLNTPEVRYRSLLVVAMAFFGQWAGNGPVSYYYPQMLAGAGISSNHTQLLLQGLQNVVSFIGAVTGAVFTDKWGRRPQLLVSTALFVALFAVVTALNATNIVVVDGIQTAKNPAQAKAEIAILFLFGFIFAAGYTPLQTLYPVECLRYESRAKGMGVYNLFVNIAGFYNTFVTGIAFSGAGWKYYFLFIFWDVGAFVVIYLFFVETKGRTLEELTEVFRGRGRVRRSLKRTEVVVGAGEEGGVQVLGKEGEGA